MILLKKIQIATISAIILSIGASEALSASFFGGGGNIPDATDSNPGIFTSQIFVPDNFTINDLTITLFNLNHTFVGDLQVSISNLATGISVDLFRNIGEDGDTLSCQDFDINDICKADLSGNYSFNDSFTGDLWATAASVGDDGTIPGGNYFPTTATAAISSLSSFKGQQAAGIWQLTIRDTEGTDVGSFDDWELTLSTSVPEPSTILGLLAFAGLGLPAARRMR